MEKVRIYYFPNRNHNRISDFFWRSCAMGTEKNTIIFKLVYQNKEYQVQTRRDQYHTLMTLIADHLSILDFGLCCGMGSCGTCMVEINEKYSPIRQFIISCNVQIDEALSNTTINIPSKNY